MSEAEMPEFPWKNMEEIIKRFKEVGMLKWIYCVKPQAPPNEHVPWEDPEDTVYQGHGESSDERVTSSKKFSDASCVQFMDNGRRSHHKRKLIDSKGVIGSLKQLRPGGSA